MARPSPTAALLVLVLVLSLLAVAHCRAIAAEHDTEPESTAAAVAVSDDSNSNPTLPTEAGAGATGEEALPAEQQHGLEFLRLPSHRLHRHRPCSSSLHRHLWWKRHHGDGVDYRDAPRRFHYSGHGAGERREVAVSHLDDVLPAAAEEASREAAEVKPVAEPDPDRSLPDSDGDGELVAATRIEPASSFVDTDGHDGDERADAAVRAWKKEMLRRWVHFRFHHGMRRHRLHHVHHHHHDGEEEEEEAVPEGVDMKRIKFHHDDDEEDDEEKNMARKRQLRHAEHDEDSDDEDEQAAVEEMVRRFRKAIMRRRRFGHGHGHGRRFFHHHLHRHAEEGKKLQADGEEESGVMAWVKGLMNRF